MLLLRLAPYELSLLVTLLCLLLAWQRRHLPGAWYLAGALASQALYTSGYLGEVIALTLDGKLFWDNLQWLPSLSTVLFWALFMSDYTGRKPLPSWLTLQLGVVPLAITLLAFTNPWHHFIGTGHRLIPGWPAPALHYALGPVAWLTLPYLLGLQALSLAMAGLHVFAQRGVFRRQALGLFVGLLLPTVAALLAVFDVKLAGYRDVSPLATAVGNLFILWALLRQRALRLVPMARELVFEHLQVGVLVIDESRQIVDANAAAAELFGGQPQELIGGQPQELIGQSAESLLLHWPAVVEAVRLGAAARLEERHPDEGTGRWIQIDIQPVADAGQSGLVLLTRDVSQQRLDAQEVLWSKEAAVLASKAKSRFVATLSHEIRTPLASVMGLSRLLAETRLDPQQRDLLRKLDAATRHLLDLLNHTLDFSKLEAGRLELAPVDFDLGSLLTSIAEMFGASASDKGLRFSLEVDPAVPHALHGDGIRLKQILTNLLGNAIKFTDRGQIDLKVSLHSQTNSEVTLSFGVADTGIGLDPAQQASLFQPFSQADATISQRFGGTGLGLSISRQLAQLLGGELTCESKKDVGSTFCLTMKLKLRQVRPKVEPSQPKSAQSLPNPSVLPSVDVSPSQSTVSPEPVSGDKPRILLAEDNQINQVVTQKMLRRIGFDCELASTGYEALRQLHSHPVHYYAAVLMDLQMPGLDGKTAVLQLRADPRYDALPIIALTGESLSEVILDALSCGMDDVLQKPVDLKTLGTVIRRHIAAKRTQGRDGPKSQPQPS